MHITHLKSRLYFAIALLVSFSITNAAHSGPLEKVRLIAPAKSNEDSKMENQKEHELYYLSCEERVNKEAELALLKYKNSDEFKQAMTQAIDAYKNSRTFSDNLGLGMIVGVVGGAVVGGGVVGGAILVVFCRAIYSNY